MLVMLLTGIAMLAFSANSFLTRLAFQTTTIDAFSFTVIRIVSGALILFLFLQFQGDKTPPLKIGWLSAFSLFIYTVAFSAAYREISIGTGALILFASAQLLMIGYGLYRGEKTSIFGLLLIWGGLVVFLAPSASAPPLYSALLMMIAGFAWGSFSLLGRSSDSAIVVTASSFFGAVPFALFLIVFQNNHLNIDKTGVIYALLSGCLATAIGNVIWYWVRVRMTAITAAVVQISVPLLSAAFGVLLLGEHLTYASLVAGLVVLGGLVLVTLTVQQKGA